MKRVTVDRAPSESAVAPEGKDLAGGRVRAVNCLAVEGGGIHAAIRVRARSHRRVPDRLHRRAVESPVDAALLPLTDQLTTVGGCKQIGGVAEVIVRASRRILGLPDIARD